MIFVYYSARRTRGFGEFRMPKDLQEDANKTGWQRKTQGNTKVIIEELKLYKYDNFRF